MQLVGMKHELKDWSRERCWVHNVNAAGAQACVTGNAQRIEMLPEEGPRIVSLRFGADITYIIIYICNSLRLLLVI